MSSSPIEHAEQLARILADALESTGLIEIIEPKAAVNTIHLMARVQRQHERDVIHTIARNMLQSVAAHEEIYIGKSFFLRNGKMRYAWVFSVASDNLEDLVDVLVASIEESYDDHEEEATLKKVDVMEAPLLGPRTPQSSSYPGARGASPTPMGG